VLGTKNFIEPFAGKIMSSGFEEDREKPGGKVAGRG